ncbi:MAG: mechanosensitive ion channel [Rickettsiaceae bacterium H1]|nr:mechanosensitive ion channel [Rickettsiaceae bacterium H1]
MKESKLFKKDRKGGIVRSVIIPKLKLPLFLLIIILSAYLSVSAAFYNLEASSARVLKQIIPDIIEIRNISIALIIAWYLLRVLSGIKLYYSKHGKQIRLVLLDKIMQITIITGTALIVVNTLGLDISGILTFGGIGGIAAGLAAKDLLANLFGSMAIALDKQFVVGDRISSPDKKISGFVTEISWRVTKIITYERRPIYIPNSLFSTIIVQNDSRMTNRRINDFIRVRFDNPGIINTITEEVTKMLSKHEGIDTRLDILANVDSIGSKIFTLHLYAFTKATSWSEYKAVRQDALIQIMKIVNSLGASLVFPDATVEVHEKELYEAVARGDDVLL